MKISLLLLFSTLLWSQSLTTVMERYLDPLRDVERLPIEYRELSQQLSNASVVIADYSLIRRDFPEVSHLTNAEIDNWLLQQVGYISQGQVPANQVNTAIPIASEIVEAFRPERYGRALVYSANYEGKEIGLFDVKGAGARQITGNAPKQNGLATLGEALREFSYEKLVNGVLYQAGVDIQVVGSYAVIDTGFSVIHLDGSQSRAGMYVLQAHLRPVGTSEWMSDPLRSNFEELLQRFGIYVNRNIQVTHNERGIYDFGHYIVRNDLKNIDPRVAIPFERWGFDLPDEYRSFSDFQRRNQRWTMSKQDYPWQWSHDVAEAFARGEINRHAVWMHHYHLIASVQEKWREAPRLFDVVDELNLPKSCLLFFEAPR